MTRFSVRWMLLSMVLLIGCNSSKDEQDAGSSIPDAVWGASETQLSPFDGGPSSPGQDSAPSVSIPAVPPPDLAVEAPAIKTALVSLSTALTARDLTAATAEFVPAARAGYRTMFEGASADKLDKLAAALAQVDVTTLVPSSIDQAVLRAEAVVSLDGRTFHVGLIKLDTQWLVETL